MKNWDTLEADVNMILTKHYTAGRDGRKIDKVIIHHNAGNLSIKGVFDVWQTRPASAHYQVESSGRIGQLVWDKDTAHHAGNWDANTSSIGIEHADVSTSPWAISEACLDNGAHLVAAICKYYGLGRPAWGVNVFGHKNFSATECPASLAGSQHEAYMERAKYWYDQMTGATAAQPAPAAAPAQAPDIDTLARDVIAGKYGTGEARKAALGAHYAAVQQRVNQILGTPAPAPVPAFDVEAAARDVIAGKYGTGEARRNALGTHYDAVQARVNQILGATTPAPAVNIDALAREVIAGKYGNGDQRKAALGANYAAVQARVNQLLA